MSRTVPPAGTARIGCVAGQSPVGPELSSLDRRQGVQSVREVRHDFG